MNSDITVSLISAIAVIASSLISVFGTLAFTNKNKKKKLLLISHTIHVDMQEYIRKIKTLDLQVTNIGRKVLISDFLSNAIKIWIEPIKEYSNKLDSCASDCKKDTSYCNFIYEASMELINDGLKYVSSEFVETLSLQDRESFMIFQSKFTIQNEYLINKLTRKVKDVCFTYNYESCYTKGSRILEAISDYLSDMINDSEFTITKLNGELTGKHYKGNIL